MPASAAAKTTSGLDKLRVEVLAAERGVSIGGFDLAEEFETRAGYLQVIDDSRMKEVFRRSYLLT